jgi:hypothetical protein
MAVSFQKQIAVKMLGKRFRKKVKELGGWE